MSNKIIKAATIILASILVGIVLVMAQGAAGSAASPDYNPATTTPVATEIPEEAYWLGDAAVFTFDMSQGLDQGFEDGSWYFEEIVGGGNPELVAPDDNYPGGFLITMFWVTYTGDINLQSGSNTNWFEKFNDYWTSGANEMTAGETTCNGTSGACSFAGYSPDPGHDWEGYGTSGDQNYMPAPHVYAQLGGASGGVAFKLQPIFYGIEEEHCHDEIEIMESPFTEGEIDATLEEGITEDLADGGSYAVEILGGPWDDGSLARYDVAYSWDGEDWDELDGSTEDAGCVEYLDGSTLYYIEAQSDSLYLRVNDEADEFDDNADEMEYKIFGVVGSGETGCGANYTLGQKVFHESWDATFNDWQYPSSKSWPGLVDEDCCYFENNDIYRILIPHTYGDGSLYNAEAQIRPMLGGSWLDLATHPQTVCVEDHDENTATEEGWIAYYFESPEDFTSYQIRAADLDGDHDAAFDNNTGGFEVEVYTATYNPPVAGCASTFETGPLIQTIRIDSMAQNGMRIPDPLYAYMRDEEGGLLAGTSYMLEEPSTWAGFTSLDGGSLWDWQISADRSTWWDIQDFAGCIQPIDAHHNKYYFDAEVDEYYIRAKDYDGDGSWQDQPGFISLNLYYADDLRASPDANGSCPNLELGDALYSGSVSSTDLDGGFLPDILQPGHLYGIQLTTPPWSDDSIDQKAAQIRLAGEDWADFEGWEGAFCSETDGNDWPLNWIQAVDDRYLLRADDSIGDNAGWVNYTIYDADWITDPIYPSCEGDYNPALFADFPVLDREIPAHWQHGQLVQDFVLRQGTYKITTSEGPWGDAGFEGYVMSYDLEISTQGGSANTWEDLEDAAVCLVPIDTDGHIRAYIEIPEGYDNLVRLRADNLDALWIDNTGSMYMDWQYSAQIAGEAIDPDAPWDPYADEDALFQSGGCNLKCVSPGGSLSVPAWLEYFRCMLVIRLSFCPYHIDVLKGMRDLFYDREPFGSLQELGQSFGLVRARVDSYQWSEDQGGEPPDVEYPDNFIFASPDGGGANIPLVGDDTIWGSGEIDLMGSSGEDVDRTCNNNLAASLGDRLSDPLCFTFNIIDSLGLSTWFQFFWDISMLIALSMYFQNRWLKPMSS